MQNIPRPAPFVLISTDHGTMIVNRNDYRLVDHGRGYGVGWQLMTQSSFDQPEVNFALALLDRRRRHFGAGVVAVDCGANIGVHTVEWGRFMTGWGRVVSFEAQEKVFYMLAGNVVLNNCLNVTARHAAVGRECGSIGIPEPDYLTPSSFGSFELRRRENTENIGQDIDYASAKTIIPLVSIDSLGLERLDFLKIDVEGMEEDVLEGAKDAISRHKPILLIEIIKSDAAKIDAFLSENEYLRFPVGINVLAVHRSDPVAQHLRFENNTLNLS